MNRSKRARAQTEDASTASDQDTMADAIQPLRKKKPTVAKNAAAIARLGAKAKAWTINWLARASS